MSLLDRKSYDQRLGASANRLFDLADDMELPGELRVELMTLANTVRSCQEAMSQATRSAGGLQTKISTQAQTIKALEDRLAELEEQVFA